MYKLKELPEDFIVNEIVSDRINTIKKEVEENKNQTNKFLYCILKKTNYTTVRALNQIANKLKIQSKRLSFAGTKDKNAITIQAISIFNIDKKKVDSINLKDLELETIGYHKEPLAMGQLKGNSFEITIRNLTKEEINNVKKKIKTIKQVINAFGPQRFSKNNHIIGKYIIKKEFKEAIELILESNGDQEIEVKEFLEDSPTDYIGALRKIPRSILKIFVHAYQSHLWNESVKEYVSKKKEIKDDQTFPVIGFGTETENEEQEELIEKIMKEEKITERDFIIRSLPELSAEGDSRTIFCKVKDFKILEVATKDELNNGKQKVKVSFSLQKGSYATVVIEELMS